MRIRHRPHPVWALLLAAAGIIISYSACGSGKTGASASIRPIVGVKIYEAAGPFDNLFRQWRGLGVNMLFLSEALLKDADFRGLARTSGMTLFLIFPVFQNPEALREDPGLAAVTAPGAPAREEWVEFVCPAREDYLSRRAAHLRDLVADFISPMCYHHMVRQSPAWIHDVVVDLSAQTHAAILASTQVSEAYVERTLAPDEFRAALEEALKPPSIGVVLWSWDALSKSPEKRKILKSSAGLKKMPR